MRYCYFVIVIFLKLLILLYADGTVLMTENHKDMQRLLMFFSHCNAWKLKINVEKTKSMVIGRCRNKRNFILNDSVIENVTSYKYLGVFFSQKWKIYLLYEKDSICITQKDTTIKLVN